MATGIPEDIKNQCEELLNTKIEAALPVSGGDINQARITITALNRI